MRIPVTIIQMHHQTLHGQRGTSVKVLLHTSVLLRFHQVDKKPHTKKKREGQPKDAEK